MASRSRRAEAATLAAGSHLAALLTTRLEYRSVWLRFVDRSVPGRLHQAAVARVLAKWLWSQGEVPDDRDTARALRDRVSRALRGESLSADTLQLFASAFRMRADDEEELWRRFGRRAGTGTGAGAGAGATEGSRPAARAVPSPRAAPRAAEASDPFPGPDRREGRRRRGDSCPDHHELCRQLEGVREENRALRKELEQLRSTGNGVIPGPTPAERRPDPGHEQRGEPHAPPPPRPFDRATSHMPVNPPARPIGTSRTPGDLRSAGGEAAARAELIHADGFTGAGCGVPTCHVLAAPVASMRPCAAGVLPVCGRTPLDEVTSGVGP
ncbi:hypothetical protein [Kitasatospora sp. NPDC086791]|uniref:hypothetical protein n=1 Tax=Kitasatospora sp. NPDC086791 TaxID=3155178 RepID=UPI003429F8F5